MQDFDIYALDSLEPGDDEADKAFDRYRRSLVDSFRASPEGQARILLIAFWEFLGRAGTQTYGPRRSTRMWTSKTSRRWCATPIPTGGEEIATGGVYQ